MRHHYTETAAACLPDTFSLLCWNVHKEMGKPAFNRTFSALLETKAPQLVLLQEAVLDRDTHALLPGYNFAAAINIDLRHRQYGVLTAATCPIHESVGIKTQRREMHFATRKSLIITTHPFGDGSILTAVNLHAINFVSGTVFVEEIDRLLETLRHRSGAMIVSGDFNTWSRKRLEYLGRFAQAIDLEAAGFENGHHIKQRFSKPLDHLYFRGIELTGAEAVDTGRVSDHNPIIAAFRK